MPPEVFYQFSIGICCKTGGLAGNFRQMQYTSNTLSVVKLLQRHTTSPQKVADEGKSPYFREIQVGQILYSGQIECVG